MRRWGLLFECVCVGECECPTWDNGDGVFLPGHHADVLLNHRGDEALEDGDISPHGALVGHTHCVGLPEHWWSGEEE